MTIRTDIYSDPFLHMIEIVDPNTEQSKPIAGANNIFAAARAFDELRKDYFPSTTLQLREKSRILKREPGTGERIR